MALRGSRCPFQVAALGRSPDNVAISMTTPTTLSLVIPSWNEEHAVGEVVRECREVLTRLGIRHEIIVVDDGSLDKTGQNATAAGAMVIRNPINRGYGFSILRGIKAATHEWIAILDADGTYSPSALESLCAKAGEFDMVVGQRTGRHYHGSMVKRLSRMVFKGLAEFTAGCRIPDINSGMRLFRRDFAVEHRLSMSVGFSFTTTITLIALLEGLHVGFIPISYKARIGRSKVKWSRDILRSLQIISEVILLYNPLKFFLLLAVLPLILGIMAGAGHILSEMSLLPIVIHHLFLCLYVAIFASEVIFAMGAMAFVSLGVMKRTYARTTRG